MTKTLAQIDFGALKIKSSVQPGGIDVNKLATGGIGTIIGALLPILFTFAGLLLLLYLLMGGIGLMTSGGDPKSVASAKGKITNAFIGFILVFVAYWVVRLIGLVFNLPGISGVFTGKI